MAPRSQGLLRLEKLIDAALRTSDFQALENFLQEDLPEGTTFKCSKQFLTKLDKLVNRSLDQKDAISADYGVTILRLHGANLSLSGGQGLSGVVPQGLVKKIKKCRQLWIQVGPQWDGILLSLAEDFFELLQDVHEASKEGAHEITETLMYTIGHLATDHRIYVRIQKEALRKLNLILEKMHVELTKDKVKEMTSSQEASDIMMKLASQIPDCGDYDFQSALIEALFRMSYPELRKRMADRWFSMDYVASAFVLIRTSEFETEIRKFLNMVNGMQGDKRRVFSYPCLEAFLHEHKLPRPPDERLEEFWMDFNIGSQSISFYVDGVHEGAQRWETVYIAEDEVVSYTVTEESKTCTLRLEVSTPICVGVMEGNVVTIHFSSSLDIRQAAGSVYGRSKDKSFVRKSGISEVKTTVSIIMDDSISQAVPESQVYSSETERNSAPYCPPRPPSPLQIVTPAKRRISESIFIINSAVLASSVREASPSSVVMPPNIPSRSEEKQSEALETIEFIPGTPKKNETSHSTTTPFSISTGGMIEQDAAVQRAVEIALSEPSFVPESQPPTMTTERSTYSHWNKALVPEMPMKPTQRIKPLSRHEPQPSVEQPSSAKRASVSGSGPIPHKQLHAQLTQRLQGVLKQMKETEDPAEDPAGSQRKGSEYSKGRGSALLSDLVAPREPQQQQHVGRASLQTKGMYMGQKSLEPDPAPVKLPVKPTPSKVLPEKVKAPGAVSSKEKKDAEVTGNMMKFISSHYKSDSHPTVKATSDNDPPFGNPPRDNRSVFNKSWFPTAKVKSWLPTAKNAASGAENQSENDKPMNVSMKQRDIFAFDGDTALNVREKKGKRFTESSAMSSRGIHDSWTLPSTTKKGPPEPVAKQQEKRYVKKHLFSDTDTDTALTEVSWLRESGRKPMPKVTEYGRQKAPAKSKAPAPDATYLHRPSSKPVKEKTKVNKERPWETEAVKPAAAATNPPAAAGRRPKRAAATTVRTYREMSTDCSQSDWELSPPPKKRYSTPKQRTEKIMSDASEAKKKKTAPKMQPSKSYRMPGSGSHSSQSEWEQSSTHKQKAKKPHQESSSKLKKKAIASAKEQMSVQEDSWAARIASFCPSPPSKEQMRSAERSTPAWPLTSSPLPPLLASPPPNCPGQLSPIQRPGSSGTQSPFVFSQPPLTSTARELDKSFVPPPFKLQSPRDIANLALRYGFSKEASVSRKLLSQCSTNSSVVSARSNRTAALGLARKIEITPFSPEAKQKPVQHHISGPSRKLPTSDPVSSNEEEDEEEERKKGKSPRSTKIRPRKLFQSLTKAHDPVRSWGRQSSVEEEKGEKESSDFSASKKDFKKKQSRQAQDARSDQTRSSCKTSQSSVVVVSPEGKRRRAASPHALSSRWAELEDEDVDLPATCEDMDLPDTCEDVDLPDTHDTFDMRSICHQFERKFERRSKVVESYGDQSLKTAQQRLSVLSMQVNKKRAQQLEDQKKFLEEEIESLEQDSITLKNAEKDFNTFWDKHTTVIHSHLEKGTTRLEKFKSFQDNVDNGPEDEKEMFTDQMCLLRRETKAAQERFIKEMHQEEVRSVRRGIRALLDPDGTFISR